jgi:hypothetical protein
MIESPAVLLRVPTQAAMLLISPEILGVLPRLNKVKQQLCCFCMQVAEWNSLCNPPNGQVIGKHAAQVEAAAGAGAT